MARTKGSGNREPYVRASRLYNDQGERWCTGHADYLPLDNPAEPTGKTFGLITSDTAPVDRLARYCRECERYRNAQQYQHHRPERDAKALRWRARHPKTWSKAHAVSNRIWRLARELDAQVRERLQEDEEMGA